jgi:hypothetical protein
VTGDLPRLIAGWHEQCARLAPEILTDPVAYSLAYLAQQIITEAVAETERLRAELDSYRGRQVLYATDGRLDELAQTVTDAPPGTIMRATDTGRELELSRSGLWRDRDSEP